MSNVLVLGADSMLGYMVRRVLSENSDIKVVSTNRTGTNGCKAFEVSGGVERISAIQGKYDPFNYVINCIGVLMSDVDEKLPSSVLNAFKVNSYFPKLLSLWAEQFGAKIIHISTDAVFETNAGSCDESAIIQCEDVYGLSKFLGEAASLNVLNVRTSIIGPSPVKGRGLLEWFLKQPTGGSVDGYTDHNWCGVTTKQYAIFCERIIKENLFGTLRSEGTFCHFCPNETISKYKLLLLFKELFRTDITVNDKTSPQGTMTRVLATEHKILSQKFGSCLNLKLAFNELTR